MTTVEKNSATTQITPHIGIEDENRAGVIGLLNKLLADAHVLYIKTRNYHWHITGPHFVGLHQLFEEQYTALALEIDEMAERIRMLGGKALGSMQEFLKHTRLEEDATPPPSDTGMVANLLEDHETLIRHLREGQAECDAQYSDMGTNDFLVGLMQAHEKMAWMLRVLLEQPQR